MNTILTKDFMKTINPELTNIKFNESLDLDDIIILTNISNKISPEKSNIIVIKKFSDCWGYRVLIDNNKEEIIYKNKVHTVVDLRKALKTTCLMLVDSDYEFFNEDLQKIITKLS